MCRTMQLYHVLDIKNKLADCGCFNAKEIFSKFDIKPSYSLHKVCERQMLLAERYILIEDIVYNSQIELESFETQLFHENEEQLYYLNRTFQILRKSKKTNKEEAIAIPNDFKFKIDGCNYAIDKLYIDFFGLRKFEIVKKKYEKKNRKKGDLKMENNIEMYFLNNSSTGYHDRISLTEIRPNPMNFYRKHDEAEEERIQNIAEQFQGKKWQKQDLIVYKNEEDDGCSYTLLSGEKRWRIAKYNFENGKGPEMVEVTVLPKPGSVTEEKLAIMQFNNHTQFSKETKLQIVKTFWNLIEEQHPEWNVTTRSKFIARYLDEESDNYDRTIRNYFAELGLTKGQKSVIEQSVDAMENEEIAEDILKEQEIKERLSNVSKEIEDQSTFKAKLKQTKKKGYTLTFSLENVEDLVSLLSVMNCEDVNLNGLD